MKCREVVSEAQNCSPQRSISRTLTTIWKAKAKIQEDTKSKTFAQIIYETIVNEVQKNTKNDSSPTPQLATQNASLHHLSILANDDDRKSDKGFRHTLQDSQPLR